jgi:hypothetical protein
MNLELLKKYFKVETVVSTTANTLLTPTTLSKGLAVGLVDTLPFEPILRSVAMTLANGVADQLMVSALRPADYQDLRELPDALIERLIEELAKKPDLFFKAFQDTLKLKG